MNKFKDCCLCNSEMNPIWSIENGVAPNLYLKDNQQEQISTQNLLFCEDCQIIENVHDFSEDNLFGEYVYRTPLTNMDDEIAEFLSAHIKKNNIKNIVEVAGNNGTFANKILGMLSEEDIRYTIIDKVPLGNVDTRVSHINSFLTKSELNNIPNLDCELVIVRHALAHNKNVLNFFKDINSILKPKQIYIENASLESTYQKKDYSQLYSEHFFSLSPFFIEKMGKLFDFKTSNVNEFKIHNGSFGILLDKNIESPFNLSNDLAISSEDLKSSISDWIEEVEFFWRKLKEKNKTVLVWGCSAKFLFTYSALNLKNIFPVSYIIDSTPEKSNLYAPGTEIKVSSENVIDKLDKNMVFVIGARNFSEHIESKILKKFPDADVQCPPF